MKRWIIYTLLSLLMIAGVPASEVASKPASAHAIAQGDRDTNAKNAAMRMKSKKRSKVAAKKRHQMERDRKKHMAEIRKSNKAKNRK